MASQEICRGLWGTVAMAVLANQECPAGDFLGDLQPQDRAKLFALFNRFAEHGFISNREKFKKIADDLFEFKSFQIRMFCFIRGRQLIVTHGVKKKRDGLNSPDIDRAERIKSQYETSN